MNDKTLNIFEFRDFKAVGSDLVTPWIDGLLDVKSIHRPLSFGSDEKSPNTGIVLPYPVEKILVTPYHGDKFNLSDESQEENPKDLADALSRTAPLPDSGSKFPDLRLVSSFRKEHKIEPEKSANVSKKIEPEKVFSYFTFVNGNSFYAMPSQNVNEIIKYRPPISIFSKKPGHAGIILYREKIVPIYDFSVLASGEFGANYKQTAKYIIICNYNYRFFGLSISEIQTVSNILNKNIIPASTFKFKTTNGILSDVFEGEGGIFYSIIDIPGVFNYITS